MKRCLMVVISLSLMCPAFGQSISRLHNLKPAIQALTPGCVLRGLESNTTTNDEIVAQGCLDSANRLSNTYVFQALSGVRVTLNITAPRFTPALRIADLRTGVTVGSASAASGSHTVSTSFTATTDFYYLFVGGTETAATGELTIKLTEPGITLSCVDADDTLCLLNRRFMIEGTTLDYSDKIGLATIVPGHTNEASNLWFFESSNWEMLSKMKDACVAPFNRFWFFAGSTTNVGYAITVTDTRTGLSKIYSNVRGVGAPAIVDTDYFTCN